MKFNIRCLVRNKYLDTPITILYWLPMQIFPLKNFEIEACHDVQTNATLKIRGSGKPHDFQEQVKLIDTNCIS